MRKKEINTYERMFFDKPNQAPTIKPPLHSEREAKRANIENIQIQNKPTFQASFSGAL